MQTEFTKEQLLECWIEVSERLINCIEDNQLESVPAIMDLREKILCQLQQANNLGNITQSLCSRADEVEKEVYNKMNARVNGLQKELQASSRQKQINTYDGYESNEVNSILNFYK